MRIAKHQVGQALAFDFGAFMQLAKAAAVKAHALHMGDDTLVGVNALRGILRALMRQKLAYFVQHTCLGVGLQRGYAWPQVRQSQLFFLNGAA